MSNWPTIPLGDVLYKSEDWIPLRPDATYQEVTVRLWGKGATLRRNVTGAEIASAKRLRVRPRQFIISRIDARNGASGIIPDALDGAVVSSDFPVFTTDTARLIPEYLGWFSKTNAFIALCASASEGTTNRVRLKESKFLAKQIPLPPLAEQRRLVEHIDAIAAKIAEAKYLRQQTNVEASLLVGLAVRDEFENSKTAGWEHGTLGDFVTDCSYGTSEKTSDDNSGTPILRMGNIQDGQLDLTDLKYLHLSPDELDKLRLLKGDILVNRTNSAELVGKSAVFDSPGDYGCASYIIRVRIDQQRANPRLIAHYINSPVGRAYMFNEKKQMTGQANVNSQTLRALPICLPALDEQNKMLQRIEALRQHRNRLCDLQSERDQELDAMLPALLHRAFQGTM